MAPAPFVVPTAELFRHPGARHRVRRAGPVDGVALSDARLTDDDAVVDLTLEAQGTVVTATGTVTAGWVGECRRCLGETGGEMIVELDEVFEPEPADDETRPLGRDHVDLGPAVRESLALALPVAPLCADTCGGPAPERHPVVGEDELGEDEDEDDEPKGDPRWAALDQLRFDR